MSMSVTSSGEFRSLKRTVPRFLVNTLAVATLIYGVLLMLVLPWSVHDAVSYGVLNPTWGVLIGFFGSMFMVRWVIVQFLAFKEHDKRQHEVLKKPVDMPFVSILVPAHNESETIVSAIHSLISLDYPRYEVIVIDDGSSDDTYDRALPLAGHRGRCTVSVFRKPNGGKWSALNLAFAKSRGELILCVDADSRLGKDALARLIPRLSEPGVVGACGQVTIRNRDNLLTRFQALEYLLGNGGMRTALSALGLVTVVPGPIGLYKREVLEEIARMPGNEPGTNDDARVYGPLSDATFAEDFQLSLSALTLGGRIVYEARANAYTKCPDRVDGLISQRYRWMRGTWQVFHIYLKQMRPISREKAKRLDWLMLLMYPVDIYLAPILNFFFWGSLVVAAATGMSLSLIVSWIGAVTLLNIMTASIYVLAHDDDFSLLPLLVFLDLYQCILVNASWVIAAVDEIRGARMKW
jgi:cellulose synthase/poly-beta-1,6-N-acetylglucosamine synthase-like glycosyltransferase